MGQIFLSSDRQRRAKADTSHPAGCGADRLYSPKEFCALTDHEKDHQKGELVAETEQVACGEVVNQVDDDQVPENNVIAPPASRINP